MPEPGPRLRAVADGERSARRRRGPGLAVILIALYAIAFGAALWSLKSQRPRPPASVASPSEPSVGARPVGARKTPDRQELASGAGLDAEARSEYLERLAVECCDCGCEMTLSRCLVGDQKCARSVQMAEERRRPIE